MYGPRGHGYLVWRGAQVSTRRGSHWSMSLPQWDPNVRVVGGNLEEA